MSAFTGNTVLGASHEFTRIGPALPLDSPRGGEQDGGAEGPEAGNFHSPLTSPGVCSLTPHSGRWILHGNLGAGESSSWLKGTGRLQPRSHQSRHPREQVSRGLGVTILTISDWSQFQDGVKGAFQVRHLL